MTCMQFGFLYMFDHNTSTWKSYKYRLIQYFIANDINEQTDPSGQKRKAIMLSAFSECTFKLAVDLALPKDINEVPYEEIIALLDGHFNPKRITFGVRHNFYAASQRPGEPYSQWAARLRGLAAQCGFLNVDEALCDKFVVGMKPGTAKEKLYAQDLTDITLTKVVELAENLSNTWVAAEAGTPTSPIFAPLLYAENLRTGGEIIVQCGACGFTYNLVAKRKIKNYFCKKCRFRGRLSKMCIEVNPHT